MQPLSILAFLVLLNLLLHIWFSKTLSSPELIWPGDSYVPHYELSPPVPGLKESMSYKLAKKPTITFSIAFADIGILGGVLASVQSDLCVFLPIFLHLGVLFYADKWFEFHRMEADGNNGEMTRIKRWQLPMWTSTTLAETISCLCILAPP